MEQAIPIEECAKQRLQVLVYAFTLFTKNLMEEGVDREKVKRASDKVWTIMGGLAAEQMKPLFGESITIASLEQVGAIAEQVHGIEVKRETSESGIRTEFIECPWQKATTELNVPKDWRFCATGHVAFTETLFKGLNPKSSYKLTKAMPDGDQICEGITSV
ncbi:MAG: hypothetical protein HKO68_12090 [Desulfobacterales bacterium]|nr:hypothetical protein [Desulfobacterales bacterium]